MRRIAIAALGLLAVSACAHDPYRYGYGSGDGYGYGYQGGDWSGSYGEDLSRPDPWLEDTREGQIILRRALGDGGYNPSAIRHLNVQFRRSPTPIATAASATGKFASRLPAAPRTAGAGKAQASG